MIDTLVLWNRTCSLIESLHVCKTTVLSIMYSSVYVMCPIAEFVLQSTKHQHIWIPPPQPEVASGESWPTSLAHYIRHGDQVLSLQAEKLISQLEQEVMPAESFQELCDVTGRSQRPTTGCWCILLLVVRGVFMYMYMYSHAWELG